MATITYENQAPETGKFVDSDNQVIDVQEFLESGQILVTATNSADPIVPVAEATTPKYKNLAPWVGKLINSENEIIDLINLLTSGQIKIQVDGGVAPTDIAYVTVTDVTDVLPNSFPLSDLAPGYMSSDGNGALVGRELEQTANQINITNRTGILGNSAFSLSSILVFPGTISFGGSSATINNFDNTGTSFLSTESPTSLAMQLAIANAVDAGISFRGGWDASGGTFPVSGGTGIAGAIEAGNWWYITTAGTLNSQDVSVGDWITALVNVPGQTGSNWLISFQGVNKVFNRLGNVVAESGDYPFNYITGLPTTATSGKLMRGNGSAWAETTATYPDTVSKDDLLVGSATNVVSTLATDLSSALTTDEFGGLRWTNLGLGEVLMGSFTSGVVAGTINSGTGLGSSFGVGTITLALSSSVDATVAQTTVTGSTQALVINNAYYTTYAGLCVMTLPTSAPENSVIEVIAGSSGNTFKIAQNSGQQIFYGAQNGVSVATTSGVSGYLQSAEPNTIVRLKCIVANTTWVVVNNVNSLTVN